MLAHLNVDDLDTFNGSQMKVVIAYPNGNVIVRNKFDQETHKVLMNVSLSKWQTAANAIFRHSPLSVAIRDSLERVVEKSPED